MLAAHLMVAVAVLSAFRIDAGAYAGAYRVAPGGAMNWYFATTALLRVRRLPLPQTRAYLDAYLAHMDARLSIADALPNTDGTFTPLAADSDDAYAATILSLAARYRAESGDDQWWHDHVATLSAVAYAKLLTGFKPDGLIRASTTNATGYLMDNVEDYVGLKAFSDALRTTQNPQAAYVSSFVAPLGAAISRLYDEQAGAFRWSDSDPLGPMAAYPACTAQIYPELYGVASGSAAADLRQWAAARRTAARCRISLAESPHEALLYALFVSRLRDPTRVEARALNVARHLHWQGADIITASLLDALGANERSPSSDRGHAARAMFVFSS
jgi:hypothetical protein